MMRSFWVLGLAIGAMALMHWGCSESETGDDDDQTTSSTTSTNTGGGSTTTTTTTDQGGSGGGALTCSVEHTNIEGECDLLAQDCPVDYWCAVPQLSNPPATRCVPHMGGLKQVGDECGATSECGLGMSCIDSRCSPFCCPSSDEPCGSGTCDIHREYSSTAYVMFCSYSTACQLFEQDCPQTPEPQDCHVQDQAQGLAVCDQRAGGFVAEGGPCIYRNDCGDSQRCNRQPPDNDPLPGFDGTCRFHCKDSSWQTDAIGEGGCPALQHCVSHGWPAFPDLGLCVLL